jgi:xylose isomerase
MTRFVLLERLNELQQLPKFHNRDIRTVSAFLSNAALEKHVKVCEEAAAMAKRSGHSDGK